MPLIAMNPQAIGDLSCSLGHSNVPHSRYCQQCGEKLQLPGPSIPQIIGDRYRVVKELGRGGFGHTYLAEDTHRFNETCVLKEFAPDITHENTLKKAKELFAREAEVLYRLQHPQIPRFREFFMDEALHALFLAQDYVLGPTYFALLYERRAQGQGFSEAEVLQFLADALPILDYIHQQEVIHRDISLDNLICRQVDQRPVLIDFGGVKQVSASLGNFNSHLGQSEHHPSVNPNITLIGKPAYAPKEQILLGQVNPSCDVYALGVTALTLLVGKEPQDFFDSYAHQFKWRDQVQVHPHLAAILDKMTASKASDRYLSAAQVLIDLPDPIASPTGTGNQPSPPRTPHTLIVSPANSSPTPLVAPSSPVAPPSITPPFITPSPNPQAAASLTNPAIPPPINTAVVAPNPPQTGLVKRTGRVISSAIVTLLKGAIILGGVIGAIALGGWIINNRLASLSESNPEGLPANPNPSAPAPQISQEERDRKQTLLNELENSRISESYFYRIVNEAYYLQYPNQSRQPLTNNPEDEALRANWDAVALQVLDFSSQISDSSRSSLGAYQARDEININQTLKQRNINRRSFYQDLDQDIAKALPMYQGQDIDQLQARQLRIALGRDRILGQ